MNRTRTVLCLALAAALSACGPDAKKPAAKAPVAHQTEAEDAAGPDTGLEDLAAPVTAPMKARDRLLHDMRKQNAEAQKRRRQFDAVIEEGR